MRLEKGGNCGILSWLILVKNLGWALRQIGQRAVQVVELQSSVERGSEWRAR
jgi:hypothetical protein